MQHFAELNLIIDDDAIDYTKIIETAFTGKRLDTVGSFNGEIQRYAEGKYSISYTDFPYYEGDEIEGYCKLLAKALPSCSFSIEGQIHNDGSAGEYVDEISATYVSPILDYSFFTGYGRKINKKRPTISRQTAIGIICDEISATRPMYSIDVPVGKVLKKNRKLLDRKPKKSDSPNRYEVVITHDVDNPSFNSSNGYGLEYYEGLRLYYYDKAYTNYSERRNRLLKAADEIVMYFRDESKEVDLESELRQGLIKRSYTLHVFRSFLWTIVELYRNDKNSISEFGIDNALSLAQFISDHAGANWECATDTYRIGAELLGDSEFFPVCVGESLSTTIDTLLLFEPLMRQAFDYLSPKSGTLLDAEKTLREAMAAWCAISLACYYGVIIGQEEQVIIPSRCRSLPEETTHLSVIDGHFYVTNNGACVACTSPSDTVSFPEGIKYVLIPKEFHSLPGAEEYYHQAKKIILPSSCVTTAVDTFTAEEIVFCANFDDASFHLGGQFGLRNECLKKITFSGTISAISISVQPSVEEVNLPNGLKQIESFFFNFRSNLDSLFIPSTVEYIANGAFHGINHVTELIVEKGSIAEKTVVAYVAERKDLNCRLI